MRGMVKVWVTPIGYSKINNGSHPSEYWLVQPNFESVELTLDIDVVESWNKNRVESKVIKKQILFG